MTALRGPERTEQPRTDPSLLRPWPAVGVAVGVLVVVALVSTGLREGPERGSLGFTFDPVSRIPQVPHGIPYNGTAHLVFALTMTTMGLVGVTIAAREALRKRTWLPVVLAASGVLAVFSEVFFDVMGMVYWTHTEANHAFTLMGREMPWTAWFGYGAFVYLTYKLLETNPTNRAIWLMWGHAMVADIVLEEIFVNFEIWNYYGNQPLIVGTVFPWWWIPCNSFGVLLAAMLTYRYRHWFTGARALLLLLLTPMSIGAVYGFIALPCWTVVAGDYPWWVTQAAGLATLALGVVAFVLALRTVLGRRAFRLDERQEERADMIDVSII